MFHKRKVDLSTLREPDQKRFRHNVSNLFLTKTVSARRANELMKDAQIAGAAGVKDLVKGAEKSGSGEKQANWEKNLARDMKRKMLKNCLWFNEYIALIPCYNPETQAEEMKKIPFLLPHEIHFVFSKRSEKKDLLQTGGMCELSKKHLANMQMQFQVREAIGLGLWIDGTPYNYDRSQTLECISLNFPGLLPPNGTLRIPLCCIPKHWCIKGVTLSKMLGILSWSFIHLANCTWPSARHDGSFWHPGDKKRSTFNGRALPFTAFLLEVRGDWAMRKEVLQFPGWRDKQGCCHLCLCKPIEIRNFESCKAFDPLDHFTLLQSISNSGIDINELFQTPGLTSKQFLLDWLHIVDLGVAADFLGNVFHHLISSGNHLPGNNVKKGWKACSTEFKATTRLKVWKTGFLLWQSSWSERKPVQVQNFEPKLQKLEGWLLLQNKSAMNFWLMTMCLNIQSRWLPQNCGNVILSCPRIYGITSQCCCLAESFCCCARAWKTRLTILGRSNQSTTAS